MSVATDCTVPPGFPSIRTFTWLGYQLAELGNGRREVLAPIIDIIIFGRTGSVSLAIEDDASLRVLFARFVEIGYQVIQPPVVQRNARERWLHALVERGAHNVYLYGPHHRVDIAQGAA